MDVGLKNCLTKYTNQNPEEITGNETLYDLGIDSYEYVEFLVTVEQYYSIALPDELLGVDKKAKALDILNLIEKDIYEQRKANYPSDMEA